MNTSFDRGILAERIAAQFLVKVQNMTILEHRYKTNLGEIDLIAKDTKNILAIVEIKQRQTIDQARYAITHHQQKRIQRCTEIFLCRQPYLSYEGIRFDAILFNHDLSERVYIPQAWVC